jgi:hypothetical protein
MQELEWNAVEIKDPDYAGALGAAAIAHDISLRVWFNDNSKLRISGQVALQQNNDGELIQDCVLWQASCIQHRRSAWRQPLIKPFVARSKGMDSSKGSKGCW